MEKLIYVPSLLFRGRRKFIALDLGGWAESILTRLDTHTKMEKTTVFHTQVTG